jgi:deoxyribodipyrimidine photolyase-related protein
VPIPKRTSHDAEVIKLVSQEFGSHPGDANNFWLPTERSGARQWMNDFFAKRFRAFGPYEDAFSKNEPFLYHSVLTPFLNTGLVTPSECVSIAIKEMSEQEIPLNSAEGFIRQVIGWREFIRGIDRNFGEKQEASNFFGARNRLTDVWYAGESGIEPLDDVIRKVQRYSYAHHIERLMVIGSLMVLLGVEPKEGYRWFMEMFVDSSDWVMGPNVYGMALFSDGGIFATKPYICGSNYYRKMGYPAGDWCDGVDGLYWSFISRHRENFIRNPRMSMMVRSLDKISSDRMARLNSAANDLRKRLVFS